MTEQERSIITRFFSYPKEMRYMDIAEQIGIGERVLRRLLHEWRAESNENEIRYVNRMAAKKVLFSAQKQKAVNLYLSVNGNLTYAEIGQKLNIPKDTVATAIREYFELKKTNREIKSEI